MKKNSLQQMSAGEYLPRRIEYIVVHCSATRENRPFTVDQLREAHLARGFRDIGYHFYVARTGAAFPTRPMHEVGAHAHGFNLHSIGICYEGGLNADGKPADTRTPQQRETLLRMLTRLKQLFPQARIVGHHQLSADIRKACPCFDARKEYKDLAE